MYQKVDTNLNFVDREKEVCQFWKENDIFRKSLLAEADSAAAMVRELGLKVRSFYMGGGTPTTLTADQMEIGRAHV